MVHLIVWVVIGLLALSFFGISLRGLYESPTNQENISFLSQLFAVGWNQMVDVMNGLLANIHNLFMW